VPPPHPVRKGGREGGREGGRKRGKEGGREGRREGGREGGKEGGREGEREGVIHRKDGGTYVESNRYHGVSNESHRRWLCSGVK